MELIVQEIYRGGASIARQFMPSNRWSLRECRRYPFANVFRAENCNFDAIGLQLFDIDGGALRLAAHAGFAGQYHLVAAPHDLAQMRQGGAIEHVADRLVSDHKFRAELV